MSWRRIALLYAFAALLAVEYRRLGRVPPAPAPDAVPARAKLLSVDEKAITRVRVTHGGRVWTAERGADGWSVRDPAEASVSAGLIDAFVSALAAAETIAQAGDASADPGAFGLDERAVRVEIFSTGTGAPAVVLLGSLNPTGTSVYARRGGDPSVVVIGRNVAYYEDLLFQALPPAQVPAETRDPVGG